ncbi:MAG: haloacid dehalogenase [Firmicutes bacterium]|nr:haloacid dehalogenase [Bacillota bacterium]
MFNLDIPGYGKLEIKNLILDYNGTIAKDGKLIEGLKELIDNLAQIVDIYVLTADTYGSVEKEMSELPVKVQVIKGENELVEKRDFIRELGSQVTMGIGNGYNDQLMFKEVKVSIAVMGNEGCATILFNIADLVVKDIYDALGLLLNPTRLRASLRG